MKLVLLFLILVLSLGSALAERPSYEAHLGIINVGGFIIFYNSQGPLSYNTLTPSEIPPNATDAGQVKCRSCQHGLSIPLTSSFTARSNVSGAQGDGSFRKALANLRQKRPELRGIYDVKIDFHQLSILGLYRRVCTEISARGFK